MPKSKRKVNSNFSKIAKELKGKVTFNIDLRKTDSNPSIQSNTDHFNFGERMALLKAWREYRVYKNSTNLIPIQRERKESKTAFKKRLRQTKNEMGQGHTHFNGVWIDTPNFAKVKTKRIKNESGKFTTEIITETIGKRIPLEIGYGSRYTIEKFVPIDPLEFANNPREVMKRIKKQFGKSDYLMPVHSGYRGNGASFDTQSFSKFTNKLIKWSNAYSQTNSAQKWLTGFIVVNYVIKPEKGAKEKVKSNW